MTDRPPLVSIVTPVLNRVSSIGLSLASVAAQTYDNVEHIVIDGGSTDGTIGGHPSVRCMTGIRSGC